MKKNLLILFVFLSLNLSLFAKNIIYDDYKYNSKTKQSCKVEVYTEYSSDIKIDVSCPIGYGNCKGKSSNGPFDCYSMGEYKNVRGDVDDAVSFLTVYGFVKKLYKTYDEGHDAFDNENYKRASELFAEVCEYNLIESSCENKNIALGNYAIVLYNDGLKSLKNDDFTRAEDLFRESCYTNNYTKACDKMNSLKRDRLFKDGVYEFKSGNLKRSHEIFINLCSQYKDKDSCKNSKIIQNKISKQQKIKELTQQKAKVDRESKILELIAKNKELSNFFVNTTLKTSDNNTILPLTILKSSELGLNNIAKQLEELLNVNEQKTLIKLRKSKPILSNENTIDKVVSSVFKAFKTDNFSIIEPLIEEKSKSKLSKSFTKERKRASKYVNWDDQKDYKYIFGDFDKIDLKENKLSYQIFLLLNPYNEGISFDLELTNNGYKIKGKRFDSDSVGSKDAKVLKSCIKQHKPTINCFKSSSSKNKNKYYYFEEIYSLDINNIAEFKLIKNKKLKSNNSILNQLKKKILSLNVVEKEKLTNKYLKKFIKKYANKNIGLSNESFIIYYKIKKSDLQKVEKELNKVADFRCKWDGVLAPEWTCNPSFRDNIVAVGKTNSKTNDSSFKRAIAMAEGREKLEQKLLKRYDKKIVSKAMEKSRALKSWDSSKGSFFVLVGIDKKDILEK